MREDVLAAVLGMSSSDVAVLIQRGMPTYCWTAAHDWCRLHGYTTPGLSAETSNPPPRVGSYPADSTAGHAQPAVSLVGPLGKW